MFSVRIIGLVLWGMLLLGCDSRPKIVGLFGEEIGEKIEPGRCERVDFGNAEIPDFCATMVKLKKPRVNFPILETDNVTASYSAMTNEDGIAEYFSFNSYVSNRSSAQKWMEAVESIKEEAKAKYGEPDYEGSHKSKDSESEEEGWYINGRTFGITLTKIKDGEAHALCVCAMTYDIAARMVVESYIKNIGGFRKQWKKFKEELPSDYVKLVETKITTETKTEEKRPYL